jgi:hypothetical protein
MGARLSILAVPLLTLGCSITYSRPPPPAAVTPREATNPSSIRVVFASVERNALTGTSCEFRALIPNQTSVAAYTAVTMQEAIQATSKAGGNFFVVYATPVSKSSSVTNEDGATTETSSAQGGVYGSAIYCPDTVVERLVAIKDAR